MRQGFTLVELAIVLVIIGLIVGGVLVGRDLIHMALLRSQISQFTQYDAAYNTFRSKYQCLPGDCTRATQYWPTLANGNGNGYIENNMATFYDASGTITWAASIEYQNFFIQLSRAGLVPGNFDATAIVGKGMPPLKYKETASFFASDTRSFEVLTPGASRNPDMTPYRRGNNGLWVTACNVTGPSPWLWDDDCGIFIPVDLKSMDEKLDDGSPIGGKVMGFGGATSQNNCLNGTKYDSLRTTPECQAVYLID